MFRGLAAVSVAICFGLVGCGGSDSLAGDSQNEGPPAVSPYDPQIDPADFVAGIDNPYLPYEPGTRFVYEGESEGETETDAVFVTHKTKEIMGVTCTVVKDVVSVEGELIEKTFDWFAQDRFGNVWYFGEYSEEHEDGKVSTAGSWEAGVDGAKPGIVMLADPDVGERYRQEYYAGEAEDMGQVLDLGASVEVPYGSFDNVLVTKDWTPLERKVLENKYYAPGVGLVLERTVRGGTGRFELVELRRP